MIPAAMSHKALLDDISAANRPDDHFRFWWLGQSGFLIQYQSKHLLLDPYLSDSLTKKYSGSHQPHLRMTELAVLPEQLDFIDIVTSSHRHTDHLDGETLRPLLQNNPGLELLVPTAQIEFSAQRLGCDPSRFRHLDAGSSLSLGPFEFHAITAAHDTVERDSSGNCVYLGYVIRFGQWTLYHSGDTIPHEGLMEQLGHFDIDLAFLPINGRAPERRVSGNFWGEEAAALAHEAGIKWVIPCHYHMFSFNSVTPDDFVRACHRLNQPYGVPRVGERWESVGLRRR